MRDRATSGGMRKPEGLRGLRNREKLPDTKETGGMKEKTVELPIRLRRSQVHLIGSLAITRIGLRRTGQNIKVLLRAALSQISEAKQKRKRQ